MEPNQPLENRKYIASSSFGKDSMATIILAHLHGEPLDEVIYCEVMFDETVSGEIPEHRDFIYETAIPAVERMGYQVTVIRPEKTMLDIFYHKRGPRSKYCGKMVGFPMVGRCEINSHVKMKAIKNYLKTQPENLVQYIGIAADEPKRLERLDGTRVSLLQKYGVDEKEARRLCKEYGLLSPVYEFTARNGCFFCPNAHDEELRHLRTYHPDLWKRMLDLALTPGIIKSNFRIEESLTDIEELFQCEDAQLSFFNQNLRES